MKKIIIRPLTNKDVYGAAEIRVNGWKQAYQGMIDNKLLNSLNIEEYIKKFEKCIGDENFIVAIENEKVVGFCRFVYDNSFSKEIDYVDCELMAIYVQPDLKRSGIGSQMFAYVLDKMNERNKTTMLLWCLKENTKSISFYKRMGGEIKESKISQIGDKNYEEVGFIYDVKELCNNRK